MTRLFLIAGITIITTVGCKKESKINLATITTTSISNISSNTAQTGGNITDNGGSTITKRGVCWATHSGVTVGDSLSSDGIGPGSFTSSLKNLYANSTYYVRAYAINASGTAYGTETSFTTNKGLSTIVTTAISNIVPLSAKSGGTILSNGGDSITARGICWSTASGPTIANFKTSDSVGSGSFISTLSPLASETKYYARAYATSSYGTAYGNEITFTASSANTVVDIDGNVYGYITIGTQKWMTSNLKVSHYRNGDPITNGLTGFDWSTATTGAYSFPNGDVKNNDAYGKYYNTYAVADSRQICPLGWHVPTQGDWETLEFNQGMSATDTARDGYRSTNKTVAAKLKEGGSSGLNLQLSGYLFSGDGIYYDFENAGYFYSSTVANLSTGSLYARVIFGLGGGWDIYQSYFRREYNSYGSSIRCIKD